MIHDDKSTIRLQGISLFLTWLGLETQKVSKLIAWCQCWYNRPVFWFFLRLNLHFLEKVPVGDDFQLLQDEEDAAADEEGLVFGKRLVQQQKVAFTSRGWKQSQRSWSTWEI